MVQVQIEVQVQVKAQVHGERSYSPNSVQLVDTTFRTIQICFFLFSKRHGNSHH